MTESQDTQPEVPSVPRPIVSRKIVAILSAAFFLASLEVAYYALFKLPRPQYPGLADVEANCHGCNDSVVQYLFQQFVFLWNRETVVTRTLAQIGVGLAAGVPIALFIAWRNPVEHRQTGRLGRIIALGALVVGIVGFGIFVASDVYFAHTGDKASWAFAVLMFADSVFGFGIGFSIMGLMFLGIATLGAAALLSRMGLLNGIKDSLAFVTAPGVAALAIGVRLFDTKEMAIHATNLFTSFSVNHIDLVSNWSALVIAVLMVIAGILYNGLRRYSDGRLSFLLSLAFMTVFLALVIAESVLTQ